VASEAWAEQAGRAVPAPRLRGRLLVAPAPPPNGRLAAASRSEPLSGRPVAVSGPQAHNARMAPLAI
jgi:hypothetical protein